jgi:protease-4
MDNNPTTPPTSAAPPPPPPPPLAPPPVIAAAQPKRKRGGRLWMVLALILLVLLIGSVLANFGLLMGNALSFQGGLTQTGGPRLQEMVVEDNGAKAKIAMIEVEGVITGQPVDGRHNMVDVIQAKLDRAANDGKVSAVILKVDSPGGEVLASDEIYRAIQEFQDNTDIPVVASMGGLAASGGYYVCAPCAWITASDMTITGSIGVILGTFNYRGLMDKVGLVPQIYKSGKHKDMLSGSRDPEQIPEEERAMLQALIDEVYGKFKGIVEEGRAAAIERNLGLGQELADNWADYADGRVFSGTEAYNHGFVDQVGTFDDAVRTAMDLTGLNSANVVRYEHIPDIAMLFRLLGKTDAHTLKLDLGVEALQLKPGHLYFLAPSLMH